MISNLQRGIIAGGHAVAAAGPEFLHDIVGLDVVFQKDATIAASYDGTSQTFANLQPNPVDGSTQTQCDDHLGQTSGITTEDPQFVGTAGTDTAYFTTDGADMFLSKANNIAGINEAIRTDLTDARWAVFAYRTPPALIGGQREFMGTRDTNHAGSFRFHLNNNIPRLFCFGDSGNTTHADGGSTLSTSTDYLIIATWDASVTGATNAKMYVNSNTPTSSTSVSFGAATIPRTWKVGMMGLEGSIGAWLEVDSRVYGYAFGQGFLTDALAEAIRDWYNANHAQTY